jgi:hypothetical protein
MPNTTPTEAETRFTVRLPTSLYDQVVAAALEDDRAVAAVIRVALREHLERRCGARPTT